MGVGVMKDQELKPRWAKMGTLTLGWQGTPALEPWWQVIFFLAGAIFLRKKNLKTLFSLCFFSLPLFLCTHSLGSF